MKELKMMSLSEFLDTNRIEASVIYQNPPAYTGDEPTQTDIKGWRACRSKLEGINGGKVFQPQSADEHDEAIGKAVAYALSGKASVLNIDCGDMKETEPIISFIKQLPQVRTFIVNGGKLSFVGKEGITPSEDSQTE